MALYVTTFCNFAHRMEDGKPVEHECYILPPAALEAECGRPAWARGRSGEGAPDYEKAIEIIQAAKPLKVHKGVEAPKPQR